jgi:hypothetical protein
MQAATRAGAKNSETGDAIAISGLENQSKSLLEGMRSAALPWCPTGAGAGPTIPDCSATLGGALLGNRTLHRLLLCLRLRFGLHRCLGHVYALSFSLSCSNQFELENTEQFRRTC